MYDYPQYKEKDLEKVVEFMRAHPFIMLVGVGSNGRIEATQVPVLIEEKEGKLKLYGHVARKTTHHDAFTQQPEVLAIFTGPHVYVSGTWYAGNRQQASTWNYIAVHARGKLNWMSEDQLVGLLQRLSLHFENGNSNSSTVYSNLPDEYKLKLVKAIDGFEMELTSIENVHKLSQNRDERSYDEIVAKLKGQDGDGKIIGEMMEHRKKEVFGS